jgi:hypothetical protein
MVLLVAEMQELRGDPKAPPRAESSSKLSWIKAKGLWQLS